MPYCPNGHYYEGDTCPYCPTQLYTDTAQQKTETLHTSVTPPYRNTEIANIPICPNCGRPVRKGIPHVGFPIIGSIEGNAYDGKVPWNYMWKGLCENCGYDFSITMTQRIDSPCNDRQTILRVFSRVIQAMSNEGYALLDAFIGLSGVEIEQRNSIDGVKKTFISTNELKYLMNALRNSPLLKQLDWNEDRT